MKSIAIITARGGSKRIPGKNIRIFCGKPIIAYGIEAALASGLFDKVMVSTDDKEIAEVSIQYGAEVPFFRSESNSDDYAVIADVIDEVIRLYSHRGEIFDIICCIYPTAPFVTAEKLQEGFRYICMDKYDSVIPVVQFNFPPQRAFVERNGFIEYQYPDNALVRSQDLEPIYHDCGQFCYVKTAAFFRNKTMIQERTKGIIVPETEVQDIDVIEDWEIAEMKYSLMKKGVK